MNALRGRTRLLSRDVRCDRSRNDRIRRLLLSEYCEFFEKILVESPFAETTRNGRGLRQVTLGITSTSLLVAADVFQTNSNFFCPPGIDASIESFELVSVYPLEYVVLSVFRRRRRRTLKARFVNGRVAYYELGGVKRKLFWEVWCEQVQKLLASKMDGSSLSETTAASSSSSSSLHLLLSSEIEMRNNREGRRKRPMFRMWTHYGDAGDYSVTPTWTEKDLYLGPSFNELIHGHYKPVPLRFAGASLEDVRYELADRMPRHVTCGRSCYSWPCQTKFGSQARSQCTEGLCTVLFARNHSDNVASCKSSSCGICQLDDIVGIDVVAKQNGCHGCRSILSEDDFKERVEKEHGIRKEPRGILTSKVSRFAFGVPEKCYSGLILGPRRGDSGNADVSEFVTHRLADTSLSRLMESGVTVWEDDRQHRQRSSKSQRHPRKYAFSPATHFFHALGPWSVQPGERDTVQGLRSPSVVHIRRQPSDPELRLPVSRRQLTASVSCVALTSGGIVGTVTRGQVTLFWTPEYWYRPQAAAVAYRQLRDHLASLQDYHRGKERSLARKGFFRRRATQISGECGGNSGTTVMRKSSKLLERVLSVNGMRKRSSRGTSFEDNTDVDRHTAQLRKLLKMNLRITVWDLDSTTLAMQLTMIDRDLFVRIPASEIEVLVHRRSSRNAPNLSAWIAFSHRIACLTVSEILAVKKLGLRTRIMARFINVADKCFALGNFQSCRSILAGLQAPPIYRLRGSWSYLRSHHASRYESMEKLSKIYKTPCCSRYQRAWTTAVCNPPCIPYVGHFLTQVLRLSDFKEIQTSFAVFSAKKRTSAEKGIRATEPMSQNDNVVDSRSANERNSAESTQCLARRVFAATLDRFKFATRRNVAENVVWSRRQQYLASRFFHRWKMVVLKWKARAEHEERTRDADSRRKHVLRVAAWLTDCQRLAQIYAFPLHSFAREFLLKARYREDRENFFISLRLETSTT